MDADTLYIILGFFQIFFLSSFILSFRASLQFELQVHLKYFFVYPAIALLMVFFFWLDFAGITSKGFYSDLNQFSLIFHLTFLSWFILKVIKNIGSYRTENTVRIIFISLMIASEINDFMSNSNYSYVLVNSMLFVYCLLYFAKLFKANSYIHLISQPSFWIITGIFIGMGITLPFYIFLEFILAKIPKSLFNLLGLIGGSGYAIMYLFFIKGFLCVKRREKLEVEAYRSEVSVIT